MNLRHKPCVRDYEDDEDEDGDDDSILIKRSTKFQLHRERIVVV